MLRLRTTDLEYPGDGLHYYGGKPFTGLIVYDAPEGWVEGEEPHRDGLAWGTRRRWHAPNVLAEEAQLAHGAYHGVVRKWHENGVLADASNYEYGVRVSGRRWDETGNLIDDFQLEESDPAFEILQASRRAYGCSDDPSQPVEPTLG